MLITNCEKWSVTSSGSKEIQLVNNKNGDRVISSMYLNPLDDCTIVVKGFVSADDTTGVTLKSVDIANLAKADSITAAGNYLFIVEPYWKVSIAVTGSADIIIKNLF